MLSKALNSKQVFVTGGARGIGAGIVRMLARDGCDVTFSYRTSEAEAETLLSALREQYPEQNFAALSADLAVRKDVEKITAHLSDSNQLYGFVHNAGMSYDALAPMVDQSRGEELMQVNFWSMTQLIKAAVRPMMRQKSGRIVAIGSITANRGAQGNATYAATKGATASFIKALSVEVARKGVTANTVLPGYVDTEMLAAYADKRAAVEERIPIGRYATSDEVGSLVAFLVSSQAACITGTEIAIDGGLSASIGLKN